MSDTIEISDRSALPEHPLVSVYMLAYRHETFIAEAIEGVIAQQRDFPMELIIGEDCSPDRTRQIALDYQSRYPALIRVIYGEANVGAKLNNARCQAAVRGDYVAICEGDDYWCDPTKLARGIDLFKKHPACSLIFHAARVVDANDGRELSATRWPFRSRRFTLKELILGDGGLVPTASILVKRSVFEQHPAWASAVSVGDYPLVLRAAQTGDVIYLDRIMSVYRSNVPHSWTQRHVPNLAHRFGYASQIDAMLTGLQAELPRSEWGAIRTTISKYYSDVLVRVDGAQEERADLYDRVRQKIRGSDRVLAWLASRHGIRLPIVKDIIRKTKTLLRVVRAQFRPGI